MQNSELDLEHVTTIDMGDWEWYTVVINYNRADGKFYWDSQSGCSCNFWEHVPDSGWKITDLAGIKKVVRGLQSRHEESYSISPDKCHKIIRQLEEVAGV